MKILKENEIDIAVNILKNGGIGIFPTDTVYGIGCNAFNLTAINKLYEIKKRNYNKPINVLISNVKMLDKLVTSISVIEQKLINAFWPGSLTIIFNKSKLVTDLLTANLDTVGIRMPNNKLCLNLIEQCGFPLATSSANISNTKPDISINEILKDFKDNVDFILNESIEMKEPSTIVRVDGNTIKILREGPISKKDILDNLGGNIYVE